MPRSKLQVSYESLGPNSTTSVLFSFKDKTFCFSRSFSSCKQAVSDPVESLSLRLMEGTIGYHQRINEKNNPYLCTLEPKGSIYKENKIGARIDPCRTPQESNAVRYRQKTCYRLRLKPI